jgi:polar amino acid transport system permease protein
VLVAACLWYLILCSILMVVQYYVERYFSRGYGVQRARPAPPLVEPTGVGGIIHEH